MPNETNPNPERKSKETDRAKLIEEHKKLDQEFHKLILEINQLSQEETILLNGKVLDPKKLEVFQSNKERIVKRLEEIVKLQGELESKIVSTY